MYFLIQESNTNIGKKYEHNRKNYINGIKLDYNRINVNNPHMYDYIQINSLHL